METLNDYKRYLLQQGLSKHSVAGYRNAVKRYLLWLNEKQMEIQNTAYRHLLAYVEQLKENGLKSASIQINLLAIQHYYELLKQQGVLTLNPVPFLDMQATKQRLLHNILSREVLDGLYQQYGQQDELSPLAIRDKCIVSLLVCQGLTVTDLELLQPTHLKLQQGMIHIPGSRLFASRKLPLQAKQIMGFMEYLQTARKIILQQCGKESDHLFVSTMGKGKLGNIMPPILEKLRGMNVTLTRNKQIRASLIVHWLKEYGLRQTQYYAGHKYISVTEAYKIYCTEQLSKDIAQYHPLR